jgi:hypothetical protein
MRNRILAMVSFLSIIFLIITVCLADNPIVQTVYTTDPAPMVYNDTLYLFTGRDEDVLVNDFFTMKEWRCYSTTDMVNWTDHGSPADLTTFSWAKNNAWAPQCVYRNGKFYLYVPIVDKNNSQSIGVGVATNIAGPYTDALGKALIGKNSEIDPTVYIDDNGQAYLYWGNPTLWLLKLNEDMISYSGSRVNMLTSPNGGHAGFGTRTDDPNYPTKFFEGPWFYKHGGLYYLVYAASGIPENICYSTSPGPEGPWTFKGVVMPSQGASWTNHPGVIDYKGNSYFFYHNGALPGGGNYHRSVCVEPFKYNADGSFPTINMTKTGASQVGHLNPYDTTQAETICWEVGVETVKCGEGGINVDSIHNGDYVKVRGVDFGSNAKSFDARVASGANGGSIEIHLDTTTGPLVGTCSVQGTGGWQTWTTKSCTVTGATGVHNLYLKFTGSGGRLFNFNWWKFYPEQTGIDGTGAQSPPSGSAIKVTFDAGTTQTLRLDFSRSVSKEYLNVGLFDLTGRLAATLFTGRLSAPHLTLPLNRLRLRMGAYLIRVSSNDKIALIKTLSLQ